jgi:DNA-binding response OmpR family regulator
MSGTTTLGGRPPTILIVDDTPANLGVVAEHLEHMGYRVLVAQDGEEALERAAHMRPDIILLDVLMPGLDGFETCRRLKAAEGTREVPVIFMTCLADAADKLTGFEAGGVEFITKPFQIEELIARTKVHLALREAQKQLEAKNAQLQEEIATRREKEAALRRIQDELEQRVQARTAELASANATLKAEITDRQRVAEALGESQRLLQAIIENATAVIYVKDLEGRYLLINRRFRTLLHITRESVAGKTDQDFFPRSMPTHFALSTSGWWRPGGRWRQRSSFPRTTGSTPTSRSSARSWMDRGDPTRSAESRRTSASASGWRRSGSRSWPASGRRGERSSAPAG